MTQTMTIEREEQTMAAESRHLAASSWPATAHAFSSAELGAADEKHPPVQLNFACNEIKFALNAEQLAAVRAAMEGHMVPDEWGATTICNLYYDTPTGLLARRSDEHPTYKEKIRVRSYGRLLPGEPVFVELKKKFKGITYKRRCSIAQDRFADFMAGKGEPATQIERELDFAIRRYEGLAPVAFIAYEREAFYDEHDHEFRMTFDRNVRARTTDLDLASGSYGVSLLDESLTLMEVKCAGAVPLWLVEVLTEHGLTKAHFSKYGTAWHELVGPRIDWKGRAA